MPAANTTANTPPPLSHQQELALLRLQEVYATPVQREAKRLSPPLSQQQKLALLRVQHAYSAKVQREAKRLSFAAKRLALVHRQMRRACAAIAGKDSPETQALHFLENTTMRHRVKTDPDNDEIGMEDIIELANEVALCAGECADEAAP
jgi:hypothetical protein